MYVCAAATLVEYNLLPYMYIDLRLLCKLCTTTNCRNVSVVDEDWLMETAPNYFKKKQVAL